MEYQNNWSIGVLEHPPSVLTYGGQAGVMGENPLAPVYDQ